MTTLRPEQTQSSKTAAADTLAERDDSGNLVAVGVRAATVDTNTAGALAIGSTTATSVSIGKTAITTALHGTISLPDGTATRVLATDGSKNLTNLAYSTSATANAIVQRNSDGSITGVANDVIGVSPIGGGTDDAAPLTTTLAVQAGLKKVVLQAGIYTFSTPCVVPSNTYIEMDPGVIIHSTMANTGVGGFTNSVFFATHGILGSSNLLTANAIQGTNTISVTSSVAVGSTIIIGQGPGGNQQQQATVLATAGGGLNLTLDEEVLYSYFTTSNSAFVSVYTGPQNIRIVGNGVKVYGTGDRVCEFAFARNVHVEGIIVDQSLGGGVNGFLNILFSFDIACRDCSFSRIRADGGVGYLSGTTALMGFAIESSNRCLISHCEAENLTGSGTLAGFGIMDARNSDLENCTTRNANIGVYIGANDIHGADGSRGISIRGLKTQACTTTGVQIDKISQARIVGWSDIGSSCSINQVSGAAVVEVSQFYWQAIVSGTYNGFTALFGDMILTDGIIDMTSTSGTKAVCDWGSASTGTLRIENVKTISGSFGLYLEDGIAQHVIIGSGVDFSSCGTQIHRGTNSVITNLQLSTNGTALVESLFISGLASRSWHDSNDVDTLDFILNGAGSTSVIAAAGATFAITQATQTSNIATNNLTLSPQPSFASATGTNRTGGNLVVNLAAPTNSGTIPSAVQVKTGATIYNQIGQYAVGSNYGCFWGGTTAPNQTNFAFLGDGSSAAYFNAPSSGSLSLSFGGAGATGLDMTTSQIACAIPTWVWYSGVASPTITQATLASGTGNTLSITSQSVTTGTASDLILGGGSGSVASGGVTLKYGAVTLGRFYDGGGFAEFDVDAGRSGMAFATTNASQFFLFRAITAGGAFFFDGATQNWRDASQSQTITWALAASGSTTVTVASTVTSFQITQAPKATGTAAGLFISSQSVTGSGTGGNLHLTSGGSSGGGGTAGNIQLITGTGNSALTLDDTLGVSLVAGSVNVVSSVAGASVILGNGDTSDVTTISAISEIDFSFSNVVNLVFTNNTIAWSSTSMALKVNSHTFLAIDSTPNITLGDQVNVVNNNIQAATRVKLSINSVDSMTVTDTSIAILTPQITWGSAIGNVKLSQGSNTGTNATASSTTIQASNATGGGGSTVGGALLLTGGSGNTNGTVQLQNAGTTIATVGAGVLSMTSGVFVDKVVTQAAASSLTLDLSTGNIQEITMGANISTLAFSNQKTGAIYTLTFIQDATGSRTLSLPTSLKVTGNTFTLTSGKGNVRDSITVYYNGTKLYELSRAANVDT